MSATICRRVGATHPRAIQSVDRPDDDVQDFVGCYGIQYVYVAALGSMALCHDRFCEAVPPGWWLVDDQALKIMSPEEFARAYRLDEEQTFVAD